MNYTFKEIKEKKIDGIYIPSDHSSGFAYCELDWRQDCVWEEGELRDDVCSIEEFFDEMVDNRFWLSPHSAFSETNTCYYTKE